MIYSEGNIIYFFSFKFPNGTEPKPKYLIVLKEINEKEFIGSLTTSKDSVPRTILKNPGCIDHPEINFNCYFYPNKEAITTNNFGFPMPTYIYGSFIAMMDKEFYRSTYSESDYEFKGTLFVRQLLNIQDCLKNSEVVKRKYRRLLGATMR